MKVLTDWQVGNPPSPGLWLARRWVPEYLNYSPPILRYFDGETWPQSPSSYLNRPGTEWCGLAFNPESADYGRAFATDRMIDAIIITEFVE